MVDLSNVVRMLIHQLDATRSYLLPSYCDEDEKARAVIAFAESALAAEPAAPDPREVLAVRPLMERIAQLGDVISGLTVGEVIAISARATGWLAENPPGQPVAIEPRGCPTPGACSCVEPPAPAPAADGAARLRQCPTHGQQPANSWACPECLRELREELARLKAPAADGEREEREELVQWLDEEAKRCAAQFHDRITRAADMLRQPAPAPVPVPEDERLPQAEDCRFNVGASLGSCWCWNPPTYAGSSGWWSFEPLEFAEAATHWLPYWAIPQPPEDEEVEE